MFVTTIKAVSVPLLIVVHLLGCVIAIRLNHVTGDITSIDFFELKNETNADSGCGAVWNRTIRTGSIFRDFRRPRQTRFPALQLSPLGEYGFCVAGVQRV